MHFTFSIFINGLMCLQSVDSAVGICDRIAGGSRSSRYVHTLYTVHVYVADLKYICFLSTHPNEPQKSRCMYGNCLGTLI
ncbi:hypothetical protein C8J57DRAFT_1368834, partial [Mycena rebaudengoi]